MKFACDHSGVRKEPRISAANVGYGETSAALGPPCLCPLLGSTYQLALANPTPPPSEFKRSGGVDGGSLGSRIAHDIPAAPYGLDIVLAARGEG